MGDNYMKKIWITLAILITILIGLSLYWQSNLSNKTGIQIIMPTSQTTYSLRQMADFQHNKVVLARDSEESYQGFAIRKLLDELQIEDFRSIIISSSDGLSVSLKPSEIRNAYLCLRQENDLQYYQLVISTDAFMQRWIKYINRIEIR
jgi:hypothetical protein